VNLLDNCTKIAENECVYCDQLTSGLHTVRQELESARKIIHLLQEDKNSDRDDGRETLSNQEISYNLLSDIDSPVHTRVKQKTNILCKGFKISTIVNGKIVKCEVKNTRRTEDKINKIQSDKCLKMRNKVQIIGNSHLKNYVDKIKQYVNTIFNK